MLWCLWFLLFTTITYLRSEYCVLPNYNYWGSNMPKSSKVDLNDCPVQQDHVRLNQDGTWSVNDQFKDLNCLARCYKKNEDNTVSAGSWMPPGTKMGCETYETVCKDKTGNEVYGDIQNHLLPADMSDRPTVNQSITERFNVFVIVLDSVSFGNAKRSLPKTLKFLTEDLGAVEFPYVNRVGHNSCRNGVPLWFGKLIEGDQNHPVDWNEDEYCNRYLDDEPHIFQQYKEKGYAVMSAADWPSDLLMDFPKCRGFQKTPYDHWSFPFSYGSWYLGTRATSRTFSAKTCIPMHVLNYTSKFISLYPDRPKFSWLWLSKPAHDGEEDLGSFDGVFEEFFRREQKVLDNSYLYVMGDHGSRLRIKTSDIELLERNNPYLAISVPRKLRNGLVDAMRYNSENLQTHFDTRASLLDIIGACCEEKGHSLFRRQPAEERSCDTLPIPLQFCMCQTKTGDINDPEIRTSFGNEFVNHINEMVTKTKFASMCENYKLGNVTLLRKSGSGDKQNFRISIITKPTGMFESFITDKNINNWKLGEVERLDTYRELAGCTDPTEKLCTCKKN